MLAALDAGAAQGRGSCTVSGVRQPQAGSAATLAWRAVWLAALAGLES